MPSLDVALEGCVGFLEADKRSGDVPELTPES